PDILAELATVQLHSIQTSGNCVRNVTTDHFAGVAPDEIVDSFVWCELIRQWSTFNAEFSYLPRKFKVAVNGALNDRAATYVHDIGLHALRRDGEVGFKVIVGGGLGRTPFVGHVIREFLPRAEILNYLDAILRTYNRFGRRDNKWKARIKILVKERGVAEFAREVEDEWRHWEGGEGTVPDAEFDRLGAFFTDHAYAKLTADDAGYRALLADNRAFARWVGRNVHPHKIAGYAIVTLSLKRTGVPPGDVTSAQMDAIADLADAYSFGEIGVSHEQNLVLRDVPQARLFDVWTRLKALGLATPNIGLLTDIVCCPGGDFCSLANAKSIPIADAITRRFDDLDYLHDIGELDLNMSGCMNACGQHHIGHIGILGVDKNGAEFYQVTIGGAQGNDAALGKVIGPSFAAAEMPDVIERLIETYLELRHEDERFVDVVRRLGIEPFKERVYGTTHSSSRDRRGFMDAAARAGADR
ncbi:MAG TPA: nitrite/sulfite reductase, partial [Casimicrobiaceae bacterium]